MKIRMRKRCDIPHSASHFQKSLIIASWLLTFLFTGTAFAQENRTITGIVRDVTGEPLIGASGIQKGTNNGVITDVDGNFNFETIEDAELIVSYIGFRTLKLKTAGENFIHVVLDEDSQLLNDVVVVGYSTNKKVNLSGSVSSLNSEKLASRRVSNVSSALQGCRCNCHYTER